MTNNDLGFFIKDIIELHKHMSQLRKMEKNKRNLESLRVEGREEDNKISELSASEVVKYKGIFFFFFFEGGGGKSCVCLVFIKIHSAAAVVSIFFSKLPYPQK